jgi:hypothetical protein
MNPETLNGVSSVSQTLISGGRSIVGDCAGTNRNTDLNTISIVLWWLGHKLNYFLICQNFEKVVLDVKFFCSSHFEGRILNRDPLDC